MRGGLGLIVSLVVLAVGLGGLSFAAHQMMTHADPNAAAKAVAGIATFVVACFTMLAIIR